MTEQIAQRVTEPVEAQETPEPKSPGVDSTTYEHTEKPLELEPYVKELWELGEASNHFKMPELIKEINDFVLSEIERNKMESNRKSYKEIIEGYEKRLKLPEGIDVYTRAEKVAELIRIDSKLLQIVKEKEDLLNGDPTKMTSSQLKKYLELK